MADTCLRARADAPRAARLARPAEAVPSTIAPRHRVAASHALPLHAAPPVPGPAHITELCTQQGTVLARP